MGLSLERWDALPEQERLWWLEWERVRRNRHRCGNDRDVCSDPEREWFPQLSVCYSEMEQAAAAWRFEQLAERRGEFHDGSFKRWSKVRSARHPYRYSDGTTVWVSLEDHGEGGDFLSTSRPEQGENDES